VRCIIAIAMALLLLGSTAGAQTITGKLIDATTGAPVDGATIALLRDDRAVGSVVTDGDGAFTLRLPGEGVFRLRADRIGYGAALTPAMQLDADDDVALEFRLLPRAVELNPITVISFSDRPPGPDAGFAERARRSLGGHFITREEIEQRHPIRIADLLATVPGVHLVPDPRGFGERVLLRGDCVPTVFLDGVPILMADMTIDDLVSPMDVEAIEVYRGPAEMPAEFAGRGDCGAIAVWTRRS
jgi:hypothetical protein